MLKGLVMSPKKESVVNVEDVEDVEVCKQNDNKNLSFRPQEGSLTAHWIAKNIK